MEPIPLYGPPSRRRHAPGALELLQAFVNTNDIEAARDAFATPDAMREWLVTRRLIEPDSPVTEADRRRAIDLREGLRELAAANNDERLDPAALGRLRVALGSLPLVARLEPGSGWGLGPAADGGIEAFLQRIVAIAVRSMADDTWSRVKACRNDGCRWLFFDHSRNRSSTWCTMAVCGSRQKARAYRARRRSAG